MHGTRGADPLLLCPIVWLFRPVPEKEVASTKANRSAFTPHEVRELGCQFWSEALMDGMSRRLLYRLSDGLVQKGSLYSILPLPAYRSTKRGAHFVLS